MVHYFFCRPIDDLSSLLKVFQQQIGHRLLDGCIHGRHRVGHAHFDDLKGLFSQVMQARILRSCMVCAEKRTMDELSQLDR